MHFAFLQTISLILTKLWHFRPNNFEVRLHFWINIYLLSDGFVKTLCLNKRDDLDFDIVNFTFLDADLPRSTSYDVYICNACETLIFKLVYLSIVFGEHSSYIGNINHLW